MNESIEKVPGTEDPEIISGSEEIGDAVRGARQILGNTYTEREMDAFHLDVLPPEAFEDLRTIRSSTNQVQRRRYLNEWLRRWRNLDTSEK